MPFGLFAPMRTRYAVLLAAALSGCAEAVQIFAVGRVPALADFAANVIGAVVGLGLCRGLLEKSCPPLRRLRISRNWGWLALLLAAAPAAALVPVKTRTDLSNWDVAFRFLFADEASGGRPWRGELLDAALAAGALSPQAIKAIAARPASLLAAEAAVAGVTVVYSLPGPLSQPDSLEDARPNPTPFHRIIRSHRFTLLARIRPGNVEQGGPARILTYSRDSYHRNFTLGQEGRQIVFRLRTLSSGPNGTRPETRTSRILQAGRVTFVAATFDGRYSRIYVDGALAGQSDLGVMIPVGASAAVACALLAGFLLTAGVSLLGPGSTRSFTVWRSAAIAVAGCALIVAVNRGFTSDWLILRFVVLFAAGIAAGTASVSSDSRPALRYD